MNKDSQSDGQMTNLAIGIDPGVNTGMAIWDIDKKRFTDIRTDSILATIDRLKNDYLFKDDISIVLIVEDARKRTWFGNTGKERLKGAGSVERDCKIWEEFCELYELPLYLIHPKNNKTKLNAEQFARITGYKGRTSVHARDAAMLVYKWNKL